MDVFERKQLREQQRILQRKSQNLLHYYPEFAGYLDRYDDPSRRALYLSQLQASGVPLNERLSKKLAKKKVRRKRTKALRGETARNLREQRRFQRGERRDKPEQEPHIVGEPRQQPIVVNVGGAPVVVAGAAGAPGAAGAVVPGGGVGGGVGGGGGGGVPGGGFGVGGGGGGLGPGGAGGGAPIDVGALRRNIVADVVARLPAPADLDPIREEMRQGYAALRQGMGQGELRRQAEELARQQEREARQAVEEAFEARMRGLGAQFQRGERRRAEGQQRVEEGLLDIAGTQGELLGRVEGLNDPIQRIRQDQQELREIAELSEEGRHAQFEALDTHIRAVDMDMRHHTVRQQANAERILERLGRHDRHWDELRREAHGAFEQLQRLQFAEQRINQQGGLMTREDRDEIFRRQDALLQYLDPRLEELRRFQM